MKLFALSSLLISTLFFHIVYFANSGVLYKSRKELNETVFTPTRIMVDNFIDRDRMNILEKFIKRFRRLFQDFGNNYKLPYMDIIFSGLFPDGNFNRNCSWGPKCVPAADQALVLLKSAQLRYADDTELIKEIETYIYVRDKIYEYASEMFKTKLTTSEKYGGYFYFFPAKAPVEMRVNGTGYIFPPHVDYCPFKVDTFDRPLEIGLDITHNAYRRYTSVLYFDDMAEDDGGILQFIDLPNKDKFPVVKGHSVNKVIKRPPIPGSTADPGDYASRDLTGGAFADKEASFTRIVPKRGKLVLLSAFDIHSVTEYFGNRERWGFVIFMTTHKLHELQIKNIEVDETKVEEVMRMAVHTPSSSLSSSDSSESKVHADESSSSTSTSTSTSTGKSKPGVRSGDHASHAASATLPPHSKKESVASGEKAADSGASKSHTQKATRTADKASDLLTDIADDAEVEAASRRRRRHSRYLYAQNDREFERLLKKEREYNSKYWR